MTSRAVREMMTKANRTALCVAVGVVWTVGALELGACSSDKAGPATSDPDGGPGTGAPGTTGAGSEAGAGDGGTGSDLTPTLATTLSFGSQIVAMAANATTHKRYVSLQEFSDGGPLTAAGIAVVDEVSRQVTTAIPPPMAAGEPQIVSRLVVDEAANVIYASLLFANGAGIPIVSIDGKTNAVSATPLNVPANPIALAVDPGKALYVWTGSSPTTPAQIMVFDTTGASPTAAGTIELTDLAETSGSLALDTTNHLLFACGVPAGGATSSAVDTIDTTTKAIKGPLKSFDSSSTGPFIDCQAGAGWAGLLSGGTTSSPSVMHELEPADLTLADPSFIPDRFVSFTPPTAPATNHHFVVLGHDENGQPLFLHAAVEKEAVVNPGLAKAATLAQVLPDSVSQEISITLADVARPDDLALSFDVYLNVTRLASSGPGVPSGDLLVIHFQQ